MRQTELPMNRILGHLGLKRAAPGYDYLRRLLLAHRERVPFETATRLLRYRDISDSDRRVRLPAEFWEESIAMGSGGTCSDSSYAFKKMLDALGFEAAMAINSEGEVKRDTDNRVLDFPRVRGHCSVLVWLDGYRYVVDPCSAHVVKVPLPVGLPYRVEVRGLTDENRPYHYGVEPLADSYHELHNLGPDGLGVDPGDPASGRLPRGQMYIFNDQPVDDENFEEHMRFGYRHGYSSTRLAFVCRNRATKTEYRFDSNSGRLKRSSGGFWEPVSLGEDLAETLARVSGLSSTTLAAALAYLDEQEVTSR